MNWECRLYGKINIQSGAIRRVDRKFDGSGDVYAAALRELSKRKDQGEPWYGDAVTVITPLGQKLIVEVPYP